jgi:hypothetical protein
MKCNYCDFTYETFEELILHLNKKHVSCGVCCKVVFDVDEFDDDYSVCFECRKTWFDEEKTK